MRKKSIFGCLTVHFPPKYSEYHDNEMNQGHSKKNHGWD